MNKVWVVVKADHIENSIDVFKTEKAATKAVYEIVDGVLGGETSRRFKPSKKDTVEKLMEKWAAADCSAILMCEEREVLE